MPSRKKGPKKPTLTPDQRKAQRKANELARDQFAALGRYVEAFEGVVSALRGHAHRIMLGDNLGISGSDPRATLPWWNITSMIFHHESMTAKNLSDIWRSLVSEYCKGLNYVGLLSENGRDVAKSVSGEIASEFGEIFEQRNRLLHATWRIGHWLPPPFDIPELRVEKYKVGADGFMKRTDLPKSFEKLMEYGNRCQRLQGKITRFHQYLRWEPKVMENVFQYSKDAEKWQKWKFVAPTPRPSPTTSSGK